MSPSARPCPGAVAAGTAEHQQPQQDHRPDHQRRRQDELDPGALEELLHLGLVVQQLGALHRGIRHQVQGAILRPLIAEHHGTQHLPRLHGGVHALAEQAGDHLHPVQVHVLGQGAGDLALGLDVHLVRLGGQVDLDLGDQRALRGQGDPAEAVKAPVQQTDGLIELALALLSIGVRHRPGAQDDRDQIGVPVLRRLHQTLARLVGGARLAPGAPAVEIAGIGPVGGECVGVSYGALLRQVGGGDHMVGAGDDGLKQLVFHGRLHHQGDVIGSGIVIGVVEAVDIDKVGPLASQLLGPLIHVLHKGRLVPVHRLRQDLGRLVGRGEQQAVQQLLHRQHLPCLDIGGGAPLRDPGRGGGGRDGGIRNKLPLLDGLQHQQRGHHLGDAGGVGFLIGPLLIQDLVVIGVQQDGVGAVQRRLLQGGGRYRQEQGRQHRQRQDQRQKT